MNKDIIEKLIKLNNESCPEFTYSNPLLDRNVTRAVSKSIVKTLYQSDQIGRKQNVRTSLLQTIRNMCKSAPEGHVEIDEDLTQVLTSFYEKELTKPTANKNIEKQLDAFLIRKSKGKNLNTSFESNVNPEVLQAMLNLGENVVFSENIIEDIVHWNFDDHKSKTLLQNLWNEDGHEKCFYDNVSIKMKSKIESLLLNILHKLLENGIVFDTLFLDCELNSLVNACSISAECFQICTSILNSLFIKTNFNKSIEKFILKFIENVKLKTNVTISVLYPFNLSQLVTILDFNLDELATLVKENYVMLAKKYLKRLHESSENDLIMLLTHFPTWFNIYFDNYTTTFLFSKIFCRPESNI